MTRAYLDFERPIAELDKKLDDLLAEGGDAAEGADALREKATAELKSLYDKIGPWEKTQVARHPDRPHFKDYTSELIEDFQPLAGDRGFADDHAIQCGVGRFRGRSVAILGHEKGNDTQSRLKHNFGMARPEGYRKATARPCASWNWRSASISR